jgi:hypothetical protein
MARRLLLSALTLVILTLLQACAQTGAGMSGSSSSPADPVVTLVRTGGFAGLHDRVVIGPDGTWTATDRAGKQRSGRLTDPQRDELRRLAADPRLLHEAARAQDSTHCADAYEYALTVNDTRVSFLDCPTDADLPQAARAVIALVARAVWG